LFALFFLKAFIPLFVIVNPIGVIPLFLAVSDKNSESARSRSAFTAGATAFAVLFFTAIAGDHLFRIFDVSLSSFQIAGGILLFAIAYEMLHVRTTRMKSTDEELAEAVDREQVGITPIGMPMLAGPGAITTILVYRAQAQGDPWKIGALLASAAAVSLVSWLVLHAAAKMKDRINPIFMGILNRVEGLILAAIAVEMAVTGLRGVLGGG